MQKYTPKERWGQLSGRCSARVTRPALGFCLPLVLSALIVGGCVTIPIKETDVFNVKRTINPLSPIEPGVTLEEDLITAADGVNLSMWLLKKERARATVLHFGGSGFLKVTARNLAEALLSLDVNVVLVDYRGYGESGGRPSVQALKSDALATYRHLVARSDIDRSRLIVYGHSLGSFVATYVAGREAAAGLILESPITDVRDWTSRMVPWAFRPFVTFDVDTTLTGESNLERIKGMTLPLLLVVGSNDTFTPPAMAEELAAGSSSRLRSVAIIPGGGHNDLPGRPEYLRAVGAFVDSVLRTPGSVSR